MASSFEIGPLHATQENAKRTQALTLIDLKRGHHPNPTAAADPENAELVKIQLGKLDEFPEQYAAGYLDDEVVAYIKYADWYVDNEIRFVRGTDKIDLLIRKHVGRTHLIEGNPLGIMGLIADPRLVSVMEFETEEVDDLLGELVDRAVSFARSGTEAREVKVPHYRGDPARRATERRGFVSTGQTGRLFGMDQELLSLKPTSALKEFMAGMEPPEK